jgi:alpha-maltose-1-phosphate synthase
MRTIHLLRKYNPAQWGGTETAIERLFDGLRQHGVQSVVYCPSLEHQPDCDPLQEAGFEIKRFRAFVPILGISAQTKRQLVSVGGNLLSFDLFSLLKQEKNADVVHTHTLGRLGGIARTFARQNHLPFVVTIHGGVLDLPAPMKRDLNKPIGGWEWGKLFGLIFQSHRLFPEADAIITCNGKEARLLQEKFPEKRILVQPHGVPAELFQQDRREHARQAFPRICGKQVLLCIGRIDSVKNQGWLIDQASQIAARHPNTLIVLAGACTDESYGQSLQQKIEQLGLTDRVLLTGGLPPNDPRLIGLLQEAAALIVPSVSETFGLVILEAWAAGTMVLSSRTSGGSTLVRSGENGWLFDLDQPETFHEQLDATLNQPELARQMRSKSNAEVLNQYSIPALAGRMKNLYEELIEEKHALRNHS